MTDITRQKTLTYLQNSDIVPLLKHPSHFIMNGNNQEVENKKRENMYKISNILCVCVCFFPLWVRIWTWLFPVAIPEGPLMVTKGTHKHPC